LGDLLEFKGKMNIFAILKSMHIVAIVISISLFLYRYSLLVRKPATPLARPLKIIPHINDTVLLAAAIGMLATLHLNPFTTPWLLAKLVALPLYIVLGAMCFRAEAGSKRQTLFFALAIAAFSYILFAALTKQFSPF
jgi:uncharacterized membrane protein SirB2